jgi:hypothetical protein
MSTALAIAAASAVIQNRLELAITKAKQATPELSILGNTTVSAMPPDLITTSTTEDNRLNLFMYQATSNASLRNNLLPSRDAEGERRSNPQLALDLNYFMSAYGGAEFHQQILLGLGMQFMHEMPVLTREAIRAAFTPPQGGSLSPLMQALATAGLAEQVETIKITLSNLNSEELSKLWTAFEGKFRPTAAYQASVVLIESRSSFKAALPVRERKIYVMPFRQPFIETVEPQMIAFAAGAKLTLRGRQLTAPNTVVLFGSGATANPDEAESTNEALVVTLPATLRAGINSAQVVQQLLIGAPELHRGFESNVAVFILRPNITKTGGPPVYNITVAPQGAGDDPRTTSIEVKLEPPVGKAQRVELLLNELNSPPNRTARAYVFEAPSRNQPASPDTTDTISFAVVQVAAGDYLVRVRVDGAESSLDLDANNRYVEPKVTI